MELLLIRHAQAESYASSDSERALTDKGRSQSREVGKFLRELDLLPDITLASPLVRARQTAETLCDTAGAESPIIQPWLACGMSPHEAMQELIAYADFSRIAIVGHEPDFSGLAGWLLGSQTGGIHVRKASVTLFSNVRPPSQGAYLELMIPVSAMS